jgi:hypothetical protein
LTGQRAGFARLEKIVPQEGNRYYATFAATTEEYDQDYYKFAPRTRWAAYALRHDVA